MGRILERAEQCWSGGVEPREFWKATGATEEIAHGVFFVHAFANVTVVRAGRGLVLVDTANYVGRDRTFAAVRAIDPAPLHAAIYTHGHADHAFGLPPFLAEAAAKGWPGPRIVGHRSVAARFDR
ncbi:MAG TPA: MBL fold metallo-hydrolase, partial [Methylomirabilota bacterium]